MTATTWIRRTCDFCGRPAGGAPVDHPLELEHVVVSPALVPEDVDLAGDMVSPAERRLDVCELCIVHVRRALTAGVRAARRARVAQEEAARPLRVVPASGSSSPAPVAAASESSQTAHATAHGGANVR